MKTYGDICSGFGLMTIGAINAGCKPIWSIEKDPEIAEVCQFNLKHDVFVKSVIGFNWRKVEKVDHLHASPPCQNASAAKANGKETRLDKDIAIAISAAIKLLSPETFTLENVIGYRKFWSFSKIVNTLYKCNYGVTWELVNFADFGVPQTRKRLILRAVKGAMVPGLPHKQAWKGWYQAVEDIIDTLPETQLAEWQIARLPEPLVSCLKQAGNPNGNRIEKFRRTDYPSPTVCASEGLTRAVLVESKNANQHYGDGLRFDNEPMTTVITDGKPSHQPRAILLDVGNTIRDCTTRNQDEPIITITAEKMRRPASTPKAFLVDGIANSNGRTVTIVDRDCPAYTVKASAGKQASRAWLEQGRVVQMTSRALARFQTLPDWYSLPDKNALACRGIGNGVPCLGAEAIVSSVMEVA